MITIDTLSPSVIDALEFIYGHKSNIHIAITRNTDPMTPGIYMITITKLKIYTRLFRWYQSIESLDS